MDAKSIAAKNDMCRTTFAGCRVILTQGVVHDPNKDDLLSAVRSFNQFNFDNDPHCEHDFGAIDLRGEQYFFKIDYYCDQYKYFKEDGNRVLTIMRADEY